MEPNNNQANTNNSPAAEDVTKYIEQNIARMINMPGLRIAVPKPALLGMIKTALKGINIIAPNSETKDIALQTLAQQVMALSALAEHGMANSLKTAPPAGISEAMQAFPKGVIPKTAYMNQPLGFLPTGQAGGGQAAPVSQMPGEGVGDEGAQKTSNQPTESEPISDTPGTPDENVNESPTAPGESNQPPQATPTHPNAVSPESANLGDGTPTFNQAAPPEQQRVDMPGFAQQEQDKQLAEQAAPDGNAPGQSPQSAAPAPGSPPSAAGATQPGGTAGSGLPGVAVPQQASAAGAATPQEQAKEALKQEKERQKAEKANTVGSIGRMKNKWGRRNEIKKVDEKIKDSTKKLRDVEFKYATEYIVLVCFKEFTDLIMATLSLTGVLAFIGEGVSAICLAGQFFFLWFQTKQWRKEVYNNKMAIQAIIVYIVELIPIVNILPLNIINAYALLVQSERRQKRHRDNLEKLEKQRHKLVNARKL